MILVDSRKDEIIYIEPKSKKQEKNLRTFYYEKREDYYCVFALSGIICILIAVLSLILCFFSLHFLVIPVSLVSLSVLFFRVSARRSRIVDLVDEARSSNQSQSVQILYRELRNMTDDERLYRAPEPGSFFEKMCSEQASTSDLITDESILHESAKDAAYRIKKYWDEEKAAEKATIEAIQAEERRLEAEKAEEAKAEAEFIREHDERIFYDIVQKNRNELFGRISDDQDEDPSSGN